MEIGYAYFNHRCYRVDRAQPDPLSSVARPPNNGPDPLTAAGHNLLGQQVTYWPTLDDQEDLNSFDAVINLAGEPIAEKRWTSQQKEILCQSRWQITERLATLINASSQPPTVFISGSAVGFMATKGRH